MRVRGPFALLLSLALTAASGCIDTDIPLNPAPNNASANNPNNGSNNSNNNAPVNNNTPTSNNTPVSNNSTANNTIPAADRCDLDAECAPGEFCELASCGNAPGEGRCIIRPDDCPSDGASVCGCDGQTYTNTCTRQLAGISPGPSERCAEAPTGCDACTNDELCACEGACGSEGVCIPTPDCRDLPTLPVCGCDGQTYANDCERQRSGTCLAYASACGVIGCGGTTDETCLEGERCDSAAGVCSDGAGPGVCTQVQPTCPDIDAPVCGCDGQTYTSDCHRIRAGVDLMEDGPCFTEPAACGGPELIPCAGDAYCDPTPGTCGALDAEGVCTPPPEVCSRRYDPVCGCDGQTYTNDCQRQLARVPRDYDGECVPAEVGCTTTLDCSSRSKRCELPPGTCGNEGPGACTPRPLECLAIIDPVCGCDGQTYTNDCERQLADVSLAASGPCE